ncbi:TPA: Coenzyme F420 hydrogenase/dehydrogenase, beta subunit C-terminal domain [Clostridium perfringens]|nr:Coenzyme F420 hydrogenase/dehydrogenase, beta subunit C-terminal domain [Clostridium perfringens]
MFTVYKEKKLCCGCGLCASICPKEAITMNIDENGFKYPYIDMDKCIECGLCVNSCKFGLKDNFYESKCYAGVNKNTEQRKLSTSAGIFSAIATTFIKEGNVVCGATMEMQNGVADVKHIVIDSIMDLPKLQGSKYVQSNFENCYEDLKKALNLRKKVLISGTPCQINNVKYVFKKYIDQLYTIDIICHGVPSIRFFNDYLQYIQNKKNIKITDFTFRNKKFGWDLIGTYKYIKSNGEQNEVSFYPGDSSYYKLFLDGEIYRESCYQCPYACQNRISDLTIGDYWGIEKYSPELMIENGGPFDCKQGVSCVLGNTRRGKEMIDLSIETLELREINIDKVLKINKQLCEPAKFSSKRNKVFSKYEIGKYSEVEKLYKIWGKKENIVLSLKGLIPKCAKKYIKDKLNK